MTATGERGAGPDPRRRAAEIRGRRAETVAAWWLRLKGYRILARRFRSGAGEIDLIIRRGRTIVFVEVKSRADETAAILAIRPVARRRIARAAEMWIARHPALAGLDRRFDVVVAVPGKLPRHLVSVFDSEGRSW
ncbi:MAG: YraN family protein [Bauldia sp.]|uniref:YraN family protein n=1 Tax=Bauldia sp. TaxID=2575872 RepID=UPI001D4D2673|nr:YraN family protein [Bauldia sp.]MCB1497930.1 YraN family protein [Bauldia sp.]